MGDNGERETANRKKDVDVSVMCLLRAGRGRREGREEKHVMTSVVVAG
jgi:hypothetical protein